MRPLLYLDTARLGQTLPAARDAQIDFVRLTAEEPSTLYFEEFLKHGYDAWPDSYQNRFPDLKSWAGVRGLKQSLRQLAGAPDNWNVLLASRSLSLVQLAARSMFQVCRNVLATDLSWPTYQAAVTQQALASDCQITTVPLRESIFHDGWTADDVTSFMARAYADNQCDGLFLPTVDNLGIRVPIRAIVERIRQTSQIPFVLVDAAQAFCHVSLDDSISVADFIVFGSHKWMKAGQPMGIGLFGNRSTQRKRPADCVLAAAGSLRGLGTNQVSFRSRCDGNETRSASGGGGAVAGSAGSLASVGADRGGVLSS